MTKGALILHDARTFDVATGKVTQDDATCASASRCGPTSSR